MISEYSVENIGLPGVYKIDPFYFEDGRGSLTKFFSASFYENCGMNIEIKEALRICSKKDTLRGIHFQKTKPIPKLVSCISGRVFSLVLDVDKTRESCGAWKTLMLLPGEQIYIPKGYAFGTYSLEDSEIFCLHGECFYSEYDAGIRWNDRQLGINWPCYDLGVNPIVSAKDRNLSTFEAYLKSIN